MGEPVAVIESSAAMHGRVRFETNRSLSGMGHERYRASEKIVGHRPVDEIARTLIETGQVDFVHIHGSMITVELAAGRGPEGLKELIEAMFIYYRPGVEVPTEESFQ